MSEKTTILAVMALEKNEPVLAEFCKRLELLGAKVFLEIYKDNKERWTSLIIKMPKSHKGRERVLLNCLTDLPVTYLKCSYNEGRELLTLEIYNETD